MNNILGALSNPTQMKEAKAKKQEEMIIALTDQIVKYEFKIKM